MSEYKFSITLYEFTIRNHAPFFISLDKPIFRLQGGIL